MNKFFTKKESETICTLLLSRDISNINLGMNLLASHPRFKCLQKYIVIRNKRKYIRGYYNISIKQNFELFYKIHQGFVKKSYNASNTKFYYNIANFVKKRTFKSK